MIAVSMDDFLATATQKEMNDDFYNVLSEKYKVKRLGQPTKYLNWSIQYTTNGIHVSQKRHEQQVAKYLNMEEASPQTTTYLYGPSIDPPTPN